MNLTPSSEYVNEASLKARTYYAEHTDLFKKLPNNILSLFSDYLNTFSVAKVASIYGNVTEGNYVFKGVTDSWIDNTEDIKYKIGVLEVDRDTLKTYMPTYGAGIESAVQALLMDIKYLAYLLNEGVMAEYIKDKYPTLVEDLAPIKNTPELKFCKRFALAGLCLPRMIRPAYLVAIEEMRQQHACADFYASVGDSYLDYKNTGIKFIDNLNVEIVRNKTLQTNQELAFFAQTVKDSINRTVLAGIPTADDLYKQVEVKKLVVYGEKEKLRLATKGEISAGVDAIIAQSYHPLSEESTAHLVELSYLWSGNSAHLAEYARKDRLSNLYTLSDLDLMEDLNTYLTTDLDNDISILKQQPPIEYPDKATDEIKSVELTEMCNDIVGRLTTKRKEDGKLFAADTKALGIAEQYLEGKTPLSEKQKAYLVKAYRSENLYSKDVDNKIDMCLRLGYYTKSSKKKDILLGLKEFQTCTSRQLFIVNEEFAKLNIGVVKDVEPMEFDEDDDMPVMIEGVTKPKRKYTKRKKKELISDEKPDLGMLADEVDSDATLRTFMTLNLDAEKPKHKKNKGDS